MKVVFFPWTVWRTDGWREGVGGGHGSAGLDEKRTLCQGGRGHIHSSYTRMNEIRKTLDELQEEEEDEKTKGDKMN